MSFQLIFLIVAIVLFLLAAFGLPSRVNLGWLGMAFLAARFIVPALALMALVGCASYQSTVQSRRISAGYNADGTVGVSDKVVYR